LCPALLQFWVMGEVWGHMLVGQSCRIPQGWWCNLVNCNFSLDFNWHPPSCTVPYDKSIAFSKVSSQKCDVEFFLPILVSSGFLKVVHLLSTSSSSSSFHFYPFVSLSCNNVFRRQFLCKMWPVQLAFLVFVVCRMFLSSLTPCNTSTFRTLAKWQHTLLCMLYITLYLLYSLKMSYS